MTFLTPLFLLGMLAVAIPVIIHLTNREKKEVIEFPSLMFVRKIPYRSVRRQKLRHLFLFALRCLALILIALAFARPFFESPQTAAAAALGPREVVFLLDNSYSMGYEDHFSRAKSEIVDLVQSLGPEDRGSLVVFSDRGAILNEPTSDKAALASLVEGVELSASTTRFGPGLKLAKKIVEESELPRLEVVLASDFQRLGFDGEDDDVWLPAGTRLIPLDVSAADSKNFAVTGATLDRDRVSGRDRLTVSARITYKAPKETGPTENRVQLEIDGRSVQSKSVTLEPNNATTVGFDPFTLPASASRGTVRLSSDALEQDNEFHFVVAPGQSIAVVNIEDSTRRARGSFYVDRALEIGDRPSFRLDNKRLSELRPSGANVDVVVLNDVASISASQASVLRNFVEKGGGLIIVLGESSSRNTFSGAASALLPAPLGETVDRSRDWGGTLSYIDYGSAIFEIFAAPHSGDFSSTKFFRYWTFASAPAGAVLARFDDGTPALVEHRMGEGRVLVWTSTLDTFWNDLARQPVYLPFVHQLVERAASYAETSSWYTIGEVADLDRLLTLRGAGEGEEGEEGRETRDYDIVLSSPSQKTTVVPRSEARALLPLEEQGFYELRKGGDSRSEPSSIAVNLDAAESDLARLDPEELVASVTFRETTPTTATTGNDTRETQEGRQSYWWFLLIGAFLLLISETLLSNRLSRGRPTPGGLRAELGA